MAYLKSSHRGRPRRKKKPVSSTLVVVILLMFIFLQFLTLLPSNADMISWSPEQSRRAAREERLIFVHVGKTAGETIQWRLKISCNLRKSKMLKAQCSKHFQDEKNESFLSRSTIGHLHCDRLRPRDSMSNATGFLFSLRNPIHRIISWYQYMHPENCFADRPSAACNLKKDNNPWGVMFYRKCFADVNDFVRAMGDRVVVKKDVNCTSVALETARGEGPAGPSNHMHFNYFYYFNRTIAQYPGRRVLAVRQEALWDDLRSVEALLGGDIRRFFEDEGPSISHGSEHFRYQANLESSLALHLCCAIPMEIKMYTEILEQAENLGNEQKTLALESLLKICEASSFMQLTKQCGWDTF